MFDLVTAHVLILLSNTWEEQIYPVTCKKFKSFLLFSQQGASYNWKHLKYIQSYVKYTLVWHVPGVPLLFTTTCILGTFKLLVSKPRDDNSVYSIQNTEYRIKDVDN